VITQATLGRSDEAKRTLREHAVRYPDNPTHLVDGMILAGGLGEYAAAESLSEEVQALGRGSSFDRARLHGFRAALAAIRGQVSRAERESRESERLMEEAGSLDGFYRRILIRAGWTALLREDARGAVRILDEAMNLHPLETLPPIERPYHEIALIHAYAGDVAEARSLLAREAAVLDVRVLRSIRPGRHLTLAMIALAEDRPRDAIHEITAARSLRRVDKLLGLPLLARAYAESGQPDSALAAYETYIGSPLFERAIDDQLFLASSLLGTADLHAQLGNRAQAVDYYDRFIQLWKSADPDLQARVTDARRKMEVLAAAEPRS
jgi:tetratricopeptide (TPR) repeat protein